MKPVLCLDFDGVLHSYASGWQGAGTVPDDPVPGAIGYVVAALDGFTVAIFSSRSKSFAGRWAMKRWLRHHLVEHFWATKALHDLQTWTGLDMEDDARVWASKVMRRISWPWFKPSAFVTIDDRAICFDGTFPAFSDVRAFKPWNKRA